MSGWIKVDKELIKKMVNDGFAHSEVLLMSEIISLDQGKGLCKASNQYFAAVLGTTDRTIQRYLKKLKDKGYVKAYEDRDFYTTLERKIYPQYEVLRGRGDSSDIGHDSSDIEVRQDCRGGTTDVSLGYDRSDTLIRKYKKEDKKVEESADAITVAGAPTANASQVAIAPTSSLEENLNYTDKEEIVILWKQKNKISDIAKQVGCTKKAVNQIIDQYKKDGYRLVKTEEDKQQERGMKFPKCDGTEGNVSESDLRLTVQDNGQSYDKFKDLIAFYAVDEYFQTDPTVLHDWFVKEYGIDVKKEDYEKAIEEYREVLTLKKENAAGWI